VRKEVEELQKMGPPPPTAEAIAFKLVGLVEKYERLLSSIEKPVTDEEARALTGILGEDDFFGLCWTLIHLIETAPSWPIDDCLENAGNEWIERLKERAARWRDAGYPARSFYKERGLPDPRTN